MGLLVLKHGDDHGVVEHAGSSGIMLSHHEDGGVGVRRLGIEEDVGRLAR